MTEANFLDKVMNIFKIFLFILLIIIQLILFSFAFLKVNNYLTYSYIVLQITSYILLIRVLGAEQNYSYKLSWAIAVLLIPSVSLIFFLLFGHTRLIKKPQFRERKINEQYHLFEKQNDEILSQVHGEDAHANMKLLFKNGSFPVYTNTKVEYFSLGETFFADVITKLKSAERFILMEHFIVADGILFQKIKNILIQKAKSGVEVYFMFDTTGSLFTIPRKELDYLSGNGIKVNFFNKKTKNLYTFLSYRSHRKIIVIDGKYAYTGGNNIADEYINEMEKYGHWKDMGISLQGDAVQTFSKIFLAAWIEQSGLNLNIDQYLVSYPQPSNSYVVGFADGPTNNFNPAKYNYLRMISNADKYVYITTPYLIIDDEMIAALTLSAKSGIDVRIIVPGIPDKKLVFLVTKAHFGVLLKAGVKIYLYTPGFMHGKVIISNDNIATIGSINFDFRSLFWNYECGAFIYDEEFVKIVKVDILETISVCQEITYPEWKNKHKLSDSLNGVLKLFGPLL